MDWTSQKDVGVVVLVVDAGRLTATTMTQLRMWQDRPRNMRQGRMRVVEATDLGKHISAAASWLRRILNSSASLSPPRDKPDRFRDRLIHARIPLADHTMTRLKPPVSPKTLLPVTASLPTPLSHLPTRLPPPSSTHPCAPSSFPVPSIKASCLGCVPSTHL